MPKTRNFADVIRQKLDRDPKLAAGVEKELVASHVASLIFEERKKAGLTQAEMASRVGTHQSVIARLEDADYDGHSLTMLMRIAAALECRVRIEFEKLSPAKTRPQPTSTPVTPRRKTSKRRAG